MENSHFSIIFTVDSIGSSWRIIIHSQSPYILSGNKAFSSYIHVVFPPLECASKKEIREKESKKIKINTPRD